MDATERVPPIKIQRFSEGHASSWPISKKEIISCICKGIPSISAYMRLRVLYFLLIPGVILLSSSCKKKKLPEPVTNIVQTVTLPDSVAPTNNTILEIRTALFDNLEIRTGPDTQFRPVQGTVILKGQPVYVIDQKDCWVCLKADTNAPAHIGWSHRFLTSNPTPESLDRDIQYLRDCGILKNIDPAANEALMDAQKWAKLNVRVQEGIGRALAFYCGYKKGTGLNWVEIGDVETHHRLAKYSENMGFKRLSSGK